VFELLRKKYKAELYGYLYYTETDLFGLFSYFKCLNSLFEEFLTFENITYKINKEKYEIYFKSQQDLNKYLELVEAIDYRFEISKKVEEYCKENNIKYLRQITEKEAKFLYKSDIIRLKLIFTCYKSFYFTYLYDDSTEELPAIYRHDWYMK